MKLKLNLIAVLTLVSLVLPMTSLAVAADFSIRLSQPKSPTNQDNFKLTFVALDTVSSRNITVKCFKKGPSDGGFSQFDVDKVILAGGNTDYCNVNNSVLNANGSYSFYVTATADSTTLTSTTATVDFNTSGPSDPSDYSKEKINSCDYKIKFKTANDGKTVKVQLFRSDSLNIGVNSSSVIATQVIGPNQAGEIVNSVPDCNKQYYFVIRSVDGSDNVSGIVGDRFTTTTTTSTTTTSTGTSPLVLGSGALLVDGSTTTVNPDGDSSSSATPNATATPENVSESTGDASVLGSETEKVPGWKQPWFWIVLAGIGLVSVIFSKKRN
jgi:hypothetical protein